MENDYSCGLTKTNSDRDNMLLISLPLSPLASIIWVWDINL